MKAILLAGGKGTRLRPLTLHTPKPIVPIFNRPFLHYQIDLIRQIPEIDEIVLSLNYQPRRIEDVFGDGSTLGIKIRYVVEPAPLGTGGAVRFAAEGVNDSMVVFNGDVLTEVDLAAVLALHRARDARATIVLTPVANPSAYGLVETDGDQNIKRFLEKSKPEEITTNYINAGIYVLEPGTFDRIPAGTPWSIERSFFPSFIERGETFVAYRYDGYWIDIGTPEKYVQVHRDIMAGRYQTAPFAGQPAGHVHLGQDVRVEDGAAITGPAFLDDGVVVRAGAEIGAYSVLGRGCHVEQDARVDGAVIWANGRIGPEAVVGGAIAGRHVHVGRGATVGAGAVLGDKTTLTDFSKV
jgi:NDP-sugar pyrophosphorylase family protein